MRECTVDQQPLLVAELHLALNRARAIARRLEVVCADCWAAPDCIEAVREAVEIALDRCSDLPAPEPRVPELG